MAKGVGVVLVMTDAQDYTADLIIAALGKRRMPVMRSRADPDGGNVVGYGLAEHGWRSVSFGPAGRGGLGAVALAHLASRAP